MKSQAMKYALAGTLAGVANGLFGAGGGLVLVPLFLSWLKLGQRESFATSVYVIAPLSAASAVTYLMQHSFDFSASLPYLAGGFLGGIVMGTVFHKIPMPYVRRAFGALLIYGGVRAVMPW